MRFSYLLAAGCGFALLFSATPVHAGTTLRYPAAKPAVVVDVPENWTAEEDKADADNHQLTFSAKDESVQCKIILMTLGKQDPKQFRSMVSKMGKASAENAKMTDPTLTGPVENKSGNGIPLTWEVAKGKIGDVDITLMIGLFTEKSSSYAIIISSESSVLSDSAKTADEIIDSIEALK